MKFVYLIIIGFVSFILAEESTPKTDIASGIVQVVEEIKGEHKNNNEASLVPEARDAIEMKKSQEQKDLDDLKKILEEIQNDRKNGKVKSSVQNELDDKIVDIIETVRKSVEDKNGNVKEGVKSSDKIDLGNDVENLIHIVENFIDDIKIELETSVQDIFKEGIKIGEAVYNRKPKPELNTGNQKEPILGSVNKEKPEINKDIVKPVDEKTEVGDKNPSKEDKKPNTEDKKTISRIERDTKLDNVHVDPDINKITKPVEFNNYIEHVFSFIQQILNEVRGNVQTLITKIPNFGEQYNETNLKDFPNIDTVGTQNGVKNVNPKFEWLKNTKVFPY